MELKPISPEDFDNVFHVMHQYESKLNIRMLLTEENNELFLLVQNDTINKINHDNIYKVNVKSSLPVIKEYTELETYPHY